jgi:hypothetical protein
LAHPDPLAVAGNLVALAVGSNQPLYPLTLYWVTGADVTGTFICFLSAPIFLAVRFVARRSSLAGRVMLVVVGAVDTFISVKIYGAAGGADLFLGPCLLLSTTLFRWRERRWAVGLTAAILAGLFTLHGSYGASYLAWSARDYAIMMDLNIVSVAILSAFIVLSVVRARRRLASV